MLLQTLFCICILFPNGFGSSLLPSPVPVRSDNLALLTETLRTYHKASCDGESMVLRCPSGTTISVQLAQYGKTVPSLGLCSAATNAKTKLRDMVDSYTNITCHLPSAIHTVVGLCQKKTSCKFHTSLGSIKGDPCPGAKKYVEIGFKCRPSEFKSVIGCDSEVIQLKCNRSSRLAIYSTNYGRTEYESVLCPQPKGVSEESCLSSFATETVMQICHGKRKCALAVNPATFGTPCKPETKMYLKVVYTCIPRQVLKDKYEGELEPDEMFDDETEYESEDPERVLEQPSIYSPDHSKTKTNHQPSVRPSFSFKFQSSRKQETLWLYVTIITVASMLLVVVIVTLMKIYIQRHTDMRRREANAALTAASSSAGPITSTVLSDIDEMSGVMDEATELSPTQRNTRNLDQSCHCSQCDSQTHLGEMSVSILAGGESMATSSMLPEGFRNQNQKLSTDYLGGSQYQNQNQCSLLFRGEGDLVNPNSTLNPSESIKPCMKNYYD